MLKVYFSLLLLAFFGAPDATAKSAEMESWAGTYSYEQKKSRPPVKFEITWKKQGKKLRGKVVEPNTFGDNGFEKLHANIKGEIKSNGEVKFTKTYDGTAGVSHSVEYSGKLNTDKNQIAGRWQVKDVSGPFVMEKEKK